MNKPLRSAWRSALLLAVVSAGIASASKVLAQFAQPTVHPTTYYLHGHIYTNDPKHPWAEAMAVRDEKILCVGTISQILLECGGAESNDVVQLRGSFVMPGFNDAHAHLGSAGQDKLNLALNDAASVEGLLKLVKAAADKHKPGEWIVGHGWDQSRWADQSYPTRLELIRSPRTIPFISTTSRDILPSPIRSLLNMPRSTARPPIRLAERSAASPTTNRTAC